ncbi:hypothetical protein ABT150_46755 [Streptomyces mirabilis]|uniref:hypothetical protein n=1 Tax=Streptomyces mirabilis TaxID=68239 RepID=UPI00331C0D6F
MILRTGLVPALLGLTLAGSLPAGPAVTERAPTPGAPATSNAAADATKNARGNTRSGRRRGNAVLPELAPGAAPCERCKGPITGPLGYDLEFAPPEDGRRCSSCRTDLLQQYPTLRQAVFGRRSRSK